jgi:small subunit ribosomal protein S21
LQDFATASGLASLDLVLAHEITKLSGLVNAFFWVRQTFRRTAVEHKTKGTGFDVQVLVRDNNVDQALRALKKKMQREGIFREMKMRDYYEKPSQKRAREKAEAVRRVRKLARKRMQREGLIAAPAPRVASR